MKTTKILAFLLALVFTLSCAAFSLAESDAQIGTYTIYNVTGEKVVSLTLTDNVTGEVSENFAGETGIAADEYVEIEAAIDAGEEGSHRLTLDFVTESGYEGKFETLSIEVAPISLLAADALTGATQIAFKVPEQTGVYTIYNVTGEKVVTLTLTDNVTGEVSENLAGDDGIEADAIVEITKSLPVTEDGSHRLTLTFVTESGYEGKFETLSIEVAPISLLAADALTGATQISFKVPQQTGVYTIYNVTGEKVVTLTLTDNVTGEVSENLAGDDGIEADAIVEITKSLPVTEDGSHRLTLTFVTESGYEGKFETLSIEVAPISLLAADALTGATQIAFKVPQQTGVYTIYNVTGEKVVTLTLTDNVTGEVSENLAGDDGIAADAVVEITKSLPVTEDGSHRLTLTFVTESGYEGKFETLSIEVAPISLLAADALTGATQIAFKAPAAE